MSLSKIIHQYSLEGEYRTDPRGIQKLFRFYYDLKGFRDQEIYLDFKKLRWFDANLCAVLEALTYKLSKENGLIFTADFDYIRNRFCVLFRNGFLQHNDQSVVDNRLTTIRCSQFNRDQFEDFRTYVNNDLLQHWRLRQSKELAKQVKRDLYELFNNYLQHSRTPHPFFVCGQYYPSQKYLAFTMVDIGIGFLPPIRNFTQEEVQTDIDAIKWALDENTTKKEKDEPGGLGLSGIHKYCNDNDSILQIATGSAMWGTDLSKTVNRGHVALEQSILGTTVSLFFNCTK